MAVSVGSLSVPHTGPLKEALGPGFAFTEHIPLRGHECHIHVSPAHNLEVGSRVQAVIMGLELGARGCQDIEHPACFSVHLL